MDILVIGKPTRKGSFSKVKFNTDKKIYNAGKYAVFGGDITIQAISNKEVEDFIRGLESQKYQLDTDYE